jgi:uncharacterized delta-60 repeat protein
MWRTLWPRSRQKPPKRKPAPYRPCLEVLEDRCLLSGGVLDPTFGSGGVVNTADNASAYHAVATATYPNKGTANDGKIVAATVAFSGSGAFGGTAYLGVSRYNVNGTLDTTFGGTGEVMNFKGDARGVAVQSDGKVVVAGVESGNFVAVRYNVDGSLDTSFGSSGEAIIKFGKYQGYAYNVALQPDGKIVLAGQVYDGSQWDVGLARLTANGRLDASFGTGGRVVTPLPYSLYSPGSRQNFTNLAIDPNTSASDPNSGKLLVAAHTPAGGAFVVRYNTNGTLDTAFGGAGHVNLTTEYPAVVVQSDDRIVVAGTTAVNSDLLIFLARLNADGTLDASFGNGGTVLSPPTPNYDVHADSVALEANGQIVVGGENDSGSPGPGLMAVRWNANGSLDSTFGSGGFATAAGTGLADAMALEPDGRIVVAGKNSYGGGLELVRFLAAGPQIGSFTASPNPATAGGNLTLTASNITDANPGATITQVTFYAVINGTNTLLGYGTQSGGAWTFRFSTAGWAAGAYTLSAVAEDGYGVFGDSCALTLTLN